MIENVNLPETFFAVLAVVAVAFAVSLLYVIWKPKRAALKKLAARFEGKVSLIDGRLRGKYQGFSFVVALIPAGRHTPPRLAVRVLKHFSFNLRIFRETSFSRLGKRLGLVREVMINDSAFDSQFLIFSSRPVPAVNFLSLNAKNTLRGLFSEGFDSFLLDYRGLAVQKPDYRLETDLDPEKFEQLLRRLLSLAGGTA